MCEMELSEHKTRSKSDSSVVKRKYLESAASSVFNDFVSEFSVVHIESEDLSDTPDIANLELSNALKVEQLGFDALVEHWAMGIDPVLVVDHVVKAVEKKELYGVAVPSASHNATDLGPERVVVVKSGNLHSSTESNKVGRKLAVPVGEGERSAGDPSRGLCLVGDKGHVVGVAELDKVSVE